jgi:hypothetical protein
MLNPRHAVADSESSDLTQESTRSSDFQLARSVSPGESREGRLRVAQDTAAWLLLVSVNFPLPDDGLQTFGGYLCCHVGP